MRKPLLILMALLFAGALAFGQFASRVFVGRQPDGNFVVSTGQCILPGSIAFYGRPIDVALHPRGELLAVLDHSSVFLVTRAGMVAGSFCPTAGRSSFRGCVWTPAGKYLYVSLGHGNLQRFRLVGRRLLPDAIVQLNQPGTKRNPVPGGMVITRDSRRLFVACASRSAVVEVDVQTNSRIRDWKVQNIPFEAKLTADETVLVVSNWAGRKAREGEERADSGGTDVAVDARGIPSSGSVSLIDLRSGRRKDVLVGLHPAGIAIRGNYAYVANAGSDTISEIDVQRARVTRTIPVHRGPRRLFGSMPNTLAIYGDKLYACCGGDNAICEIDLSSGRAKGFRPAGFYPVGIQISADGRSAYVVNTKGNGSVSGTSRGRPGNVHHFQGSVSVVDLSSDLRQSTRLVSFLANRFRAGRSPNPNLAVYKGAVKHVLYIIKENRTYDSILGDMQKGNGYARFCMYGEAATPNHHAIAREFGLFDNAYVSGTNSAEGHQWAVEGLANDYIERFYSSYARSYPFDGSDPMAYASSGFIWDAAIRRGKSVRIYGEFCRAARAKLSPHPKTWLEAWQDRESGANRIRVRAHTDVAGMRKLIHPNVIGWPLVMSDQWRADRFIEDYRSLSKADRVPNLMILTLPADHTEGLNPGFPTPRAMMADNDLALGRVVEAVSKSAQWRETCVFVMEDDAQFGLDHVDGHRTVAFVASPFVRRGVVDSTLYTQISVVRSIGLMLGLDPMNRFDALATPFTACFTDTLNLRPYTALPATVRLDEMNRPFGALRGQDRLWAKRSAELDWGDVDSADWATLNRILWYDARPDSRYPFEG